MTIEASFTVNNVPDAPAAMLFIRDIQYSPSGQVTRAVYGNGDVEVYTYNPLNLRLTRKVTTNALGQSLQDFEYIYDNTGNIVQIIDHVHSANQNFQYDELSRLTRAEGTDALGYGVKNFSFDEIGNLIAKDGKFYYYDNTGNAGPHAVTGLSDGTTFTYDANGNLASKSEAGSLTEYSYDIENRLTQVKKNAAVIATYQYDGDGGRTKKTAVNPTTQQTQTTTYVGSLYEEIDGQKIAYVMLGNMVVGSLRDGKMLYYHTDHLGSTNVVTDAQGAVKELTEYQPFGTEGRHEKYGTSDEVALYYFTGKPKDDETGLYYYGARYYNPSLGRFITPDTIIEDPANPQSLNRYSYVLNNPINRIDPTGHWSWKKFWNSFAGAVVGAVVTVATGGLGTPLAFALGGMTGGAITGGLEGGWKGALMGGLMGGALGGGVGLGVSAWGSGFGYAALAAGGGYAIGTGHADSFVGGLAGGVLGGSMADGYLSAKNDGLSERGPTEGIRAWVSADDNENWAFLGINTTDKGAQAFANENQMTVIYSKSHGLLSDLFRAGFKKLGVSGPYARQSANYLNVAEGKFILPYSEGTLNLGSGIKLAAANGIKFQNLEIKWIGPVISRSTAMSLSNSIRAQSSYYLNFGDPVGALTTMNPVRMGIYGGVGLATFAIFHGENYYVQ